MADGLADCWEMECAGDGVVPLQCAVAMKLLGLPMKEPPHDPIPKEAGQAMSVKIEIHARIARENQAEAAAWRYLSSKLHGLINHATDARKLNLSSVKRHLRNADQIVNEMMKGKP